MRKLAVLVVLGVFSSLPLSAQVLEVFGGYQYLHLGDISANGQTIPGSSQSFNGWNANAAVKLSMFFGLEGDVGGGYTTVSGVGLHTYTYAGGPVISVNVGPVKPFFHALAGGARFSESQSGVSASWNGLTAMAGGGLDVKANRFVAVRLAQVDWLYFHFGSQTIAGTPFPAFSGSKNVRVSSGLVLRF
jgi:hypothetical protein